MEKIITLTIRLSGTEVVRELTEWFNEMAKENYSIKYVTFNPVSQTLIVTVNH